MKKIIIIFLVVFSFANVNVKETIKLIHILNNIDFSYKEITNLYNPFVLKTNMPKLINTDNYSYTAPVKIDYNLEVVFQNKVRINNKWYKIGDKIDGYVIKKKNDKIFLEKNNKKIVLTKPSIIGVK